MQEAVNNFTLKQPIFVESDIDLSLISLLTPSNRTETIDDSINYWLKPIGSTDRPVTPDRLFDEMEYHLHFSKRKPVGVKPNDILIAYGVGTAKILSIYKATSSAIHVTQEEIDEEGDDWIERWPWYVTAENLAPNFGRTWDNLALFLNNQVEEYLTLNPNASITLVGGNSLGALNWGQDKINLATGFAKFIISRVMAFN